MGGRESESQNSKTWSPILAFSVLAVEPWANFTISELLFTYAVQAGSVCPETSPSSHICGALMGGLRKSCMKPDSW